MFEINYSQLIQYEILEKLVTYIVNDDWMDLNLQQNFNSRLLSVQINDFSNLKIGKNILMNKMGVLNNEINYSWLNLSLTSFKLKCKEIFLSN